MPIFHSYNASWKARLVAGFRLGLLVLALGAIVYGFSHQQQVKEWAPYLKEAASPWLVLMFLCLGPVLGFPISVLLLVCGARFGIAWGVAASFLAVPINLVLSYVVANSMFRPLVERICQRFGMKVPRMDSKRGAKATVLVFVTPGPPYVLKNYAMAVSGVDLARFVAFGSPAHMVTVLPYIVAGGLAVKLNVWAMAGAGFALGGAFLLANGMRKKINRKKMAVYTQTSPVESSQAEDSRQQNFK